MNSQHTRKVYLVQKAYGTIVSGFATRSAASRFALDANEDNSKHYATKPYTFFPVDVKDDY